VYGEITARKNKLIERNMKSYYYWACFRNRRSEKSVSSSNDSNHNTYTLYTHIY